MTARAFGPEYYDDAISDPASPHLLPNPDSPWHDLYTAVARMLSADPEPAHIIDVGCGTGRLAALIDPARGTTASYVGVDFSPQMIFEAIRYTHERCERTKCLFSIEDITERKFADPRYGIGRPDATYLLLEVLEHLDDDLAILRAIPGGARLIISVPSTDSAAHVRYFPTVASALERYAGTVDVETWQRIWTPERHGFWHLITATGKDNDVAHRLAHRRDAPA